ncbi:NAD-dependent succinate-semialdehyde dehydrogenase [Flexivirga endophytica]|uniref:NAD-dependent succinate-semialdehyde dehydrogenase n=1 Tax=Flexivirga endophytica TaxID=1849103 RepID=A0A916SXZ7_9MICO|nr:NAD-dependent succinate-semialdehyde dehydrogenase [Flexivirga endophytica]GGB21407.1 NAD-dependent succinate-semialdehyde dehydrogenase [Flexivirga endophytica]GHB59076.1 NAD-dependent succinate-semialdehyde dehydrogenase [Flexivirga endophytica]
MSKPAPGYASPVVEELHAKKGVFVNGEWVAGASGTFAVDDPATSEVIAQVADGSSSDATAAVDSAAASFISWASTPPRVRSAMLSKVRDLMLRDSDQLAELISLENGKSRADARAEVGYAAEFFRWYAEEAVRPGGGFGAAPAGGSRTIVTHEPVGVAALVTPWNFPAAMATRKIAPALAAGCTVVLKPAAETPLTAIAVTRLIAEAGVPAGVVNLVPSTDAAGVVETWLSDPRVRKISFTGSTRVGRELLRRAADRVVNTSMELGGNAPFVITESANLDAAVEGAMIAKFRNGGQACTAANGFFVHESVAEEFTARLGAAVEALVVGSAADGAEIGPLVSREAVEKVEGLVADALSHGARVAHRAPLRDELRSGGYFYPPTVVTGVSPDAALVQEEIFGPVAPIVLWRDIDAVLSLVNGSEFGLAAYVFGELGQAVRLGERIHAGMVAINRGMISDPAAPFGGTKQSGVGREGGRAGLEAFLETKYLSVDWV